MSYDADERARAYLADLVHEGGQDGRPETWTIYRDSDGAMVLAAELRAAHEAGRAEAFGEAITALYDAAGGMHRSWRYAIDVAVDKIHALAARSR